MMFGNEYVLSIRSFLASPLADRDEKFAKGARDDARIGSRCSPTPARQVMNADFPVAVASPFQLVEQLGIDHRSPCFEWVLMQKIGAQEFEGAIDIARVYAQNIPDEDVPAPGVEFAHPRVLAIEAIANDRVVFVDEEQQAGQVTNIELPIGVHKKRQLFRRGGEAIYQRRAIALIALMCNQPDTWLGLHNGRDDGPGTI